MASEDLITKNAAKYISNLAIEHIEKENCLNDAALEILGGIKKDIDDLEPAESKPLTPCERDGHNYKEIYIDSSNGYDECYCTKCRQMKNIKF